MAREREIKLKLILPFEEFLARLSEHGFKKEKEIEQIDNYFDTPDWYLYKNVAALRTRKVNKADHSFSFKKVFHLPLKKDSVYVEEIEKNFPITDESINDVLSRLKIGESPSKISSLEDIETFLLKNGFQNEQLMRKIRQVWNDNSGNEVVIDDVDLVGTVVELECREDEPMEFVNSLLSDNEWGRSIEGTSYAWLEKAKGFTDHLSYEKKFNENPRWNVWDNEQEIYGKLVSEDL
jgi:adenylate cyclase class IV